MDFIELDNKILNQVAFMLKTDTSSTPPKQNISQKKVLNYKTIDIPFQIRTKKYLDTQTYTDCET